MKLLPYFLCLVTLPAFSQEQAQPSAVPIPAPEFNAGNNNRQRIRVMEPARTSANPDEALPHNYQLSLTVTEAGKPATELSVVLAQRDAAFKVDAQEPTDEATEAPPNSVVFNGTMRLEADGKLLVSYAIGREFAFLTGQRSAGNDVAGKAQHRSYQFKTSTLQGSARLQPGVSLNIGKSGSTIYALTATKLSQADAPKTAQ